MEEWGMAEGMGKEVKVGRGRFKGVKGKGVKRGKRVQKFVYILCK